MAKSCRRYFGDFSTNSLPTSRGGLDYRGPQKFLRAKLAKGRPQLCDGARSETRTDLCLSLPPCWQALANQRIALVGYFDLMASAIFVPLESEPAPRAHPLDVAAQRRFVHLKQFGQFRGPGLAAVGHCYQHAELTRLQSRVSQRAVIDSGDHPIQFADASTEACAFNALDNLAHTSLYMQVSGFCQGQIFAEAIAKSKYCSRNAIRRTSKRSEFTNVLGEESSGTALAWLSGRLIELSIRLKELRNSFREKRV